MRAVLFHNCARPRIFRARNAAVGSIDRRFLRLHSGVGWQRSKIEDEDEDGDEDDWGSDERLLPLCRFLVQSGLYRDLEFIIERLIRAQRFFGGISSLGQLLAFI